MRTHIVVWGHIYRGHILEDTYSRRKYLLPVCELPELIAALPHYLLRLFFFLLLVWISRAPPPSREKEKKSSWADRCAPALPSPSVCVCMCVCVCWCEYHARLRRSKKEQRRKKLPALLGSQPCCLLRVRHIYSSTSTHAALLGSQPCCVLSLCCRLSI